MSGWAERAAAALVVAAAAWAGPAHGGRGAFPGDGTVGAAGSFWSRAPVSVDCLRWATPMARGPGGDQACALTAFVLNLDGIVDGELVRDAVRLAVVHGGYREGFAVGRGPRGAGNSPCPVGCAGPPRVIGRARVYAVAPAGAGLQAAASASARAARAGSQ